MSDAEYLRGIVAKLPKTADSVPIVPGDTVWLPSGTMFTSGLAEMKSSDILEATVSSTSKTHIKFEGKPWSIGCVEITLCYSTYRAASAAKEPANAH